MAETPAAFRMVPGTLARRAAQPKCAPKSPTRNQSSPPPIVAAGSLTIPTGDFPGTQPAILRDRAKALIQFGPCRQLLDRGRDGWEFLKPLKLESRESRLRLPLPAGD